MARGAREAVVSISVDGRKLDSSLRTSSKKIGAWAKGIGGDVSKAMRGSLGSLATLGGLGGIAGFAAAAKDVLEFETRLVRLQASSRATAQQMLGLRKQIFEVAKARGLDPAALLGGVEEFVKLTGRFDDATASLDAFAMVASATGSDMTDINTAASAMFTNMHISASEMKDAFGGMLAQGKAGAVELKDMAGILAELTPKFKIFKSGAEGLKEMGAVLQIVRSGFSSAKEASTGLNSLMTAITSNEKALAKAGIQTSTTDKKKVKTYRDFKDIVADIAKKSKGDPAKLMKWLGRSEAVAAMLPLIDQGIGKIDELVAVADTGAAELDADFALIAQTPAFKIEQAKATMKEILNESLARYLPDIASAIGLIAKAIGFIADNSVAVIGVFAAMKTASKMRGLGEALMEGAGGAAGGAGGKGGAAAAASRRGRGWQMAGNAVAGAGVGLAISTLGPELGDAMDDVSTAGLAAAGALASLPGPIGLVGKGIVALDLLTKAAVAGIEHEQNKEAARAVGTQATKENIDELLGPKLIDEKRMSFNPIERAAQMEQNRRARAKAAKVSPEDKMRAARTTMREVYEGGAGFTLPGGQASFDPSKADAMVDAMDNLTDEEKTRKKESIRVARDIVNSDRTSRDDFVESVSGTSGVGPLAPATNFVPEGNFPDISELPGMKGPMPAYEKPGLVRAGLGALSGFVNNTRAEASGENRMVVSVELTLPDGVEGNDPKIRRKGH